MRALAVRAWHDAVWFMNLVLPITSPSDPKHICWTAVVIVTTLYMAFDVPLLISFSEWRHLPMVGAIGWISSGLLCFDVVVNLRTTYITPHGDQVRNPRLIALNYIRGTFWLDLLSGLPLDELVETLVGGNAHNHLYWMGLMRLPRLIVLLGQLPCMVPTEYFNLASVGRLLLVMILITHSSACLWYYFSQKFSNFPWAFSVRCENWSARDKYLYAFYRSFLLLLGDRPSAYNNIERSFFVVLLTLGACVYAIVVGSMSLLVSNMWSMASRHKQRAAMVQDVLKYNGVDEAVRNKAYHYFYYMAFHDHPGAEGIALLSELPVSLHAEVLSTVFEPSLFKVQLFTNCEQPFLWRLAQRLRLSLFMKRDVLYETGSVGHDMFIVWKGAVALVDPDGGMTALMTDGDHFGELCLMAACIPRPHRAVAVLPTDVMMLSRHDLVDVMRDFPESAQFVHARARIHLEDHEIGPAVWMTALFEEPLPFASGHAGRQGSRPVIARRRHPRADQQDLTPSAKTLSARPVSEAIERDSEAMSWQPTTIRRRPALSTEQLVLSQRPDRTFGSYNTTESLTATLLTSASDWPLIEPQVISRTQTAVRHGSASTVMAPIEATAAALIPVATAAPTAAAAVNVVAQRQAQERFMPESTTMASATEPSAPHGSLDLQQLPAKSRWRFGFLRSSTADASNQGQRGLMRSIQDAINAAGRHVPGAGTQQPTNAGAMAGPAGGPVAMDDGTVDTTERGDSVLAYSQSGPLMDAASASSTQVVAGPSILELPPQPFLGTDPLGSLFMAAVAGADLIDSQTKDMWQSASPLVAFRAPTSSLSGNIDNKTLAPKPLGGISSTQAFATVRVQGLSGSLGSGHFGGMRPRLHERTSNPVAATASSPDRTGSITTSGTERRGDGWRPGQQQGGCNNAVCTVLRQQLAQARQQVAAAQQERDQARSQLMAVMEDPLKVPAIMAACRKEAEALASGTNTMLKMLLRQLQEVGAHTDELSQSVSSVDDRLQLLEERQGNLSGSGQSAAALLGVRLSKGGTEDVFLDTSTTTQDLLAALSGPSRSRLQQQQQQQQQVGSLPSPQGASNGPALGSTVAHLRHASVPDHRQAKISVNGKKQSNVISSSISAAGTLARQQQQPRLVPSLTRTRSQRRMSLQLDADDPELALISRRSELPSPVPFRETRTHRADHIQSSAGIVTIQPQTEVPRAPLNEVHSGISAAQPETEVLVATAASRGILSAHVSPALAAVATVNDSLKGLDDVVVGREHTFTEAGRSCKKTVRRRRSALDLWVLVSKKSIPSCESQGSTAGPSAPYNPVHTTMTIQNPQTTVQAGNDPQEPARLASPFQTHLAPEVNNTTGIAIAPADIVPVRPSPLKVRDRTRMFAASSEPCGTIAEESYAPETESMRWGSTEAGLGVASGRAPEDPCIPTQKIEPELSTEDSAWARQT